MGLIAKSSDSRQDFEPTPEGLHIGICYGLFDLGTQHNNVYNNDEHKVLLIWELPNERIEIIDKETGIKKDLPRAISNRYTLSLGEKARLRHDLETWRGKQFTSAELEGFDLQHILGAACQLQVIHNKSKDNTKTFANIGGIVQAPKDYKPKIENQLVFFSFEDGGEIPEGVPEWIEKIIHNSKEWKLRDEKQNQNQTQMENQSEMVIEEDDLPF